MTLHHTKMMLRHISLRLQQIRRTHNQEAASPYLSLAKQWWLNSETDPLFLMNQTRVPFIRDALLSANSSGEEKLKRSRPLDGLSLLDIGCGVGFLTESLARLGAQMTSIDPEEENIKHAKLHIQGSSISQKINYRCGLSDDLLQEHPETFDGVIASEVIEHVENPEAFVNTAVQLTKLNGSLFFTTINRTWWSYITAIIMAEKILKIVPYEIHDWNMFIKPDELSTWLENSHCDIQVVKGMKYNPLTKNFSWCRDTSDNYALWAIKKDYNNI